MLTLKSGDDKTLDFDMTRAEYIKAMTPEQRKQLEDFKKKNCRGDLRQRGDRQAECDAEDGARRSGRGSADQGRCERGRDQMKEAVDAKPDAGFCG